LAKLKISNAVGIFNVKSVKPADFRADLLEAVARRAMELQFAAVKCILQSGPSPETCLDEGARSQRNRSRWAIERWRFEQ
jgi:hypothetical protein